MTKRAKKKSTSGGVSALRTSDEAVKRATGRKRAEWFELLDRFGAVRREHREIADHLARKYRVPGWWTQMLTVEYEQARGLRKPGSDRSGTFTVSASKTVDVSVKRLFQALMSPSFRARWLPGKKLRERTSQPPRSARFDWQDGKTRVIAGFYPKGKTKSQVALAHERLPNAGAAKKAKIYWSGRMTALGQMLASRSTS
jgi:hypothetical protein